MCFASTTRANEISEKVCKYGNIEIGRLCLSLWMT